IALVENGTSTVLRASKFIVNASGSATESDRAGKNNDWTNIPNSHLTIILSYTQKWKNLGAEQRANFAKGFYVQWSPSQIDNRFPHLTGNNAQLYASKGYELQKTNYK